MTVKTETLEKIATGQDTNRVPTDSTTARTEILEKIAAGHNNSRKLAEATPYSQEYIRRVVVKLARDRRILITREPRGHTYVINHAGVSQLGFMIGDQVCNTEHARERAGIVFAGVIAAIHNGRITVNAGGHEWRIIPESWVKLEAGA